MLLRGLGMFNLGEADNLGGIARNAAQTTRNTTSSSWDEERITQEFTQNLSREFSQKKGPSKYLVDADYFSTNHPRAESATGADFYFVIVFASETGISNWGIISQAKYFENASNRSTRAQTKLANQCETMQSHTSASFATIYYDSTYRFFPASQIVSDINAVPDLTQSKMGNEFANRASKQFFKEVFYGMWLDPWVADNLNQLLTADDESDIPNRGAVSTDGGENGGPSFGTVIIAKGDDVGYSVSQELEYQELGLFLDSDI
jgi:hypothetical protein